MCTMILYILSLYEETDQGPSLVDLGKVLKLSGGVSLEGVSSLGPVSRADFTVLVGELEGVEKTQSLLDVAANGQIVNSNLTNIALGVNDEDTAESDTHLGDENTVVRRERVVLVRNERDLDRSETTILSRDVGPGKESVLRVDRGKDDLGTALLELGRGIGVGNNLGRADKGEGHGDEGEDEPLALVLVKRDILERTVNDGGLSEGGSGFLNSNGHC